MSESNLDGEPQERCKEAKFVDDNFAKLIERVTSLMPIADELRSKDMLHGEKYDEIKAEKTNQEKMRKLFESLNCGDLFRKAFYYLLEKHQPQLFKGGVSRKRKLGDHDSPVPYKRQVMSNEKDRPNLNNASTSAQILAPTYANVFNIVNVNKNICAPEENENLQRIYGLQVNKNICAPEENENLQLIFELQGSHRGVKHLLSRPTFSWFGEHDLTVRHWKLPQEGESCSSSKTESSSAQSSSEDAEVFTPELLQGDDVDKHKNTYRFVCPHAGQFRCSLTSLVFVMEGEGEVLYKTVSWDPHVLDGLGQMQPAGPLYNIDCFHGSISQLHFQHCEIFSEENKDGLAVAHLVGGNVEIIQPLKVTETHVMIDISELSNFGLVWIKSIFGIPIRGQVLLFLRNLTLERKKLNIHLLPGNVPISEVQSRHCDKKYIETSSKCHLIPNQKYSLCCQPEKCEVQPETEIFECDNFDQNYHPTFEVFLDINIEEVILGILDKTKGGKEVWNRRRIFLTAPSEGAETSEDRRIPETEFVDTHGDELIQRVSSVMPIADSLKCKMMITGEMWGKIKTAEPKTQKMRLLLDALDSGGASVKAEVYKLLKENEPFLVDDLESGPS